MSLVITFVCASFIQTLGGGGVHLEKGVCSSKLLFQSLELRVQLMLAGGRVMQHGSVH